MSAQTELETWTEAEYWAMEEKSEIKHEFIGGRIYRKPDESYNHGTVCMNILCCASARLHGKECRFLSGDMKIKAETTGDSFYSNGVIFCPPSRFIGKGNHTLCTPTVIFEALSPTTAANDRGDKFTAYRQIESLTDYVLIEPERVFVDHYRRTPEGWLLRNYTRRDDVLQFPDLGIELPLDEIYEELDVPEALLLLLPPQLSDEDEDEDDE